MVFTPRKPIMNCRAGFSMIQYAKANACQKEDGNHRNGSQDVSLFTLVETRQNEAEQFIDDDRKIEDEPRKQGDFHVGTNVFRYLDGLQFIQPPNGNDQQIDQSFGKEETNHDHDQQ